MSRLTAELHTSEADAEWDSFVATSVNGTFLHSRAFLNYHGPRFRDQSCVLRNRSGELAGVFPAAIDPDDDNVITSHPGLTFGGIVVGSRPQVSQNPLSAICSLYSELGYRTMLYKAVPFIYHARPSLDDLYSLFLLDAHRVRCDLAATIDLQNRGHTRSRRNRDIRARKSSVQIEGGPSFLDAFWPVLEHNRRERHGVLPTHTKAEIRSLAETFPTQIQCVVAFVAGELVAGVVVFRSNMVDHLQYMANSMLGRQAHALDVLVEHCIESARLRGARFFDFGISTVDEGRTLNEGLHAYKSSFGAGSTVYEQFEVVL